MATLIKKDLAICVCFNTLLAAPNFPSFYLQISKSGTSSVPTPCSHVRLWQWTSLLVGWSPQISMNFDLIHWINFVHFCSSRFRNLWSFLLKPRRFIYSGRDHSWPKSYRCVWFANQESDHSLPNVLTQSLRQKLLGVNTYKYLCTRYEWSFCLGNIWIIVACGMSFVKSSLI